MGQAESHMKRSSAQVDDIHLKWVKQRYAELEDVSLGLTPRTFSRLLDFPGAESIGKLWLALHPDIEAKAAIPVDDFIRIIRDSTKQTPAEFMFSLFAQGGTLSREDAFRMFNTARVLALAAGYHDRDAVTNELEDQSVAQVLAEGLFEAHKDPITKEMFIIWIHKHTPRLFNGVFRWIEIQVSTPSDHKLHETHKDLTDIVISLEGENLSSCVMSPSLAWLLSSSFPPEIYDAHGSWKKLFSSSAHGQSGNRFQHHTYRYLGPSITVIKARDGSIYAVAVDQEWKERSAVWGGDNCRLFRAAPSVAMFPDPIRIYDDLKTRHKHHGFGFGPKPEAPETAILWLDGGFAEGKTKFAASGCGTEQPVEIDHVEVWGCGGDDALSSQDRQRKRDHLAAEQRQRAKRPDAHEWHDSVDRQILTMAGVLTLDEQSREDMRKLREESHHD